MTTTPDVGGARNYPAMTPDYFRDLLLTHFVPPVLGLMLLSAAASLLVAGIKGAVRRAIRSSR